MGLMVGQPVAGTQLPAVIWKPGVSAPGVYPTFAAALAVIQAVTIGPVVMGVDTSGAAANVDIPGMPAGGWDMQARIAMQVISANFGIVTIPDGATLKNFPQATNAGMAGNAGASGLPSLSYTQSMAFVIDNGSWFPTPTAPQILIGSGVVLDALVRNQSFIQTRGVGKETFKFVDATGFLVVVLEDAGSIQPGKDLVTGAGTVFIQRDCTTGHFVRTAAFTGPAITSVLQQGPIIERAVAIGGAVTYVIDATALATTGNFDNTIFAKPTAGNVTRANLPDPTLTMNLGRVIRIVDANGGSSVSPIVLGNFAGSNLNGANAPQNLQGRYGSQWFARSDGAQWMVWGDAGSLVVGTLGAQSLASPKVTAVATTVAAAVQLVDTGYRPGNNAGALLSGTWVGIDRTIGAEVVTGGEFKASVRVDNAGVLTIAAQSFVDQLGDAALGTAVPSLQVNAGNHVQVTFTPPVAYGTNIDWRLELTATED
ncbi:MAG: hypothetical protein ACHQQR_00745 [Gemmatimonadales bacterium]